MGVLEEKVVEYPQDAAVRPHRGAWRRPLRDLRRDDDIGLRNLTMADGMDRRKFLKDAALASAGLGLGIAGMSSGAETKAEAVAETSAKGMPVGKIGTLAVSRLISGGNLISGWAHSRDLMYVDDLMRAYNTDEKVMDTLEILEQAGVNTIIADPSERPYRIFPKYWKQRGGKIQWIAEGHPEINDLETDIKTSVDKGASGVYIQGVIGDRWLKEGHLDLLGKCMEIIKRQGVPTGIGAHELEVIVQSEAMGYGAEFYVKTLHHHNYWSARPSEQNKMVIESQTDNYWSRTPAETIEFMKEVEKPWIAFKVLAAGAIKPEDGFLYAFEGGADFICVGMFDFQVRQDAGITTQILKGNLKRQRPWRA